jgi:ribonucleoside-diphosphate reductase alpha chain
MMTVGVQRCGAHTVTVTIGAERLCLTASQREDGGLGEVFIRWGTYGTGGAGLLDTYAAALSAGLRHRIPLPDLIRPGLGLAFAPSGRTDDPEIPRVRSAIDYVTRRLAIDWLPYPDRAALGVFTPGEHARFAAFVGITSRLLAAPTGRGG